MPNIVSYYSKNKEEFFSTFRVAETKSQTTKVLVELIIQHIVYAHIINERGKFPLR